ncbi:uncharacterized protein J3D65DRAFT_636738 [Phyllosticta citribraziliensis]|uniref:Uncharacterized protein n=1 Tax=Phyllosticta citribraziliensis TaxID=989973 RepID=A0ABR1LEZ1_9PEZI
MDSHLFLFFTRWSPLPTAPTAPLPASSAGNLQIAAAAVGRLLTRRFSLTKFFSFFPFCFLTPSLCMRTYIPQTPPLPSLSFPSYPRPPSCASTSPRLSGVSFRSSPYHLTYPQQFAYCLPACLHRVQPLIWPALPCCFVCARMLVCIMPSRGAGQG